jgi:hypothetical protein
VAPQEIPQGSKLLNLHHFKLSIRTPLKLCLFNKLMIQHQKYIKNNNYNHLLTSSIALNLAAICSMKLRVGWRQSHLMVIVLSDCLPPLSALVGNDVLHPKTKKFKIKLVRQRKCTQALRQIYSPEVHQS